MTVDSSLRVEWEEGHGSVCNYKLGEEEEELEQRNS